MDDGHHPHDLGYLLNRAARLSRARLAPRLRDLRLTPPQAAALLAMASEGPMTPTRLALAIDADAPTTTGLVQRLARDGWVTTSRSETDGRSRVVRPTPKASAALPALFEATEAASADAARSLSGPDRAQLERLLGLLLDEEER